ncbi:MAG: 5' nucleotidase, NT5C type [Mycobacterium leprae]
MTQWRVLLDLDGTVAQNAGRRIAAREFGITLTEEQYAQRLPELLGLTDEQFWAWWHEHQEEIYDQADLLPGAAETVRWLKESGAYIVVVTARRGTSEAVTRKWLHRYQIPYDQMVFGADDKVAVAKELGLNLGFEDDPNNALALAEWLPMILIENFKNRHEEVAHPGLYRVADWSEVLPLLATLAERSA